MKHLVAAALAAISIGSIGSVAHATVYTISSTPLADDTTYSAPVIQNLVNTTGSAKTFTDYFNFTIPNDGEDFTAGGANMAKIFGVTSIDLTLFSGSSDNGLGTALGASTASLMPQLDVEGLTAGSYYIEATIVVPAHKTGSYNLYTTFTSAAPEPASWALMIVGLGMAGCMMRFARRSGAFAAA